ncbi:MAG: hypothetical protein BGN88_02705 [Clostridiales bacterium 43-6]|nr:MAG: hypothetical protein BGN88_02705 [Clostridiales bacterium 43-6]
MSISLINTPVALVFFIRPETFRRVFDAVKKARPAKLFLIQDGPRAGYPEDMEKILACRKIAEEIDWDCEIYKNYSEVNLGCGVRPYSGISWVFEHVDRAIILEGDCIPDESFFGFCDALLEQYKDDERIAMISGLNHFGTYDCGKNDYFFGKTGAIWGWATWKRVWAQYDYRLRSMDDTRLLQRDIRHNRAGKRIIRHLKTTRQKDGMNVSYWDTQWDYIKYSQSMLCIIPAKNLICNVGIGTGSTHSASEISLLPKKIGDFFYKPVYPVSLPLSAPPTVLCSHDYDKRYYNTVYPNMLVKAVRKLRYYRKMFFRRWKRMV